MINIQKSDFYRSPVGKKIITAVTGLGLILFVLIHMAGNLVLLTSPQAYNELAHLIDSFGFLLYVIEFILLVLVVFHLAIGIAIRVASERSRPVKYLIIKSAGTPSKQSLSSRSMLFTGIVLLVFLVSHLWTFKFGTYYLTSVNGIEMRDLAQLVIETFQKPWYTFSYLGAITLLGLHLRHGIWSAWQSLGMLNSSWSSLVYAIALVMALLIVLGFVVLPLAIYFDLLLWY